MSKNNFLANFKLEKQEYVEETPTGTVKVDTPTNTENAEEQEDGAEIEGNPLIGKGNPEEKPEVEIEEETKKDEVVTKVEKKPEDNTEESQEEISFSPFIADLAEEGILIKPEDEKKYGDNLEGFRKLVEDTVQAKLDAKIESLPEDVKRLIKEAKEGVDVKQLLKIENEEIDFSKIDIEDPDNQYNLVLDHLLLTGLEEKEAKELVDGYKDANLLSKHAKVAVKQLAEVQTKRKNDFIAAEKAKAKVIEDRKIQEETNFKKKVLETTKIGEVEIPKTEAEKLYNYMTKIVKDGKTQYDLDGNEDNRIMLAYLMMNKFDTKKIATKVETKKTKEIKKALTRYTDKNSTSRTEKSPEVEKTTLKLPKLTFI